MHPKERKTHELCFRQWLRIQSSQEILSSSADEADSHQQPFLKGVFRPEWGYSARCARNPTDSPQRLLCFSSLDRDRDNQPACCRTCLNPPVQLDSLLKATVGCWLIFPISRFGKKVRRKVARRSGLSGLLPTLMSEMSQKVYKPLSPCLSYLIGKSNR